MSFNSFLFGPVAEPSTFAPTYSGENSDIYNQGVNDLGDSIGNIATGNADWNRQVATMQYNAREAEKSRDWQERLSNTAYQRAVKDLKEAGLNPFLAMTGGASPATTPAGDLATTGSSVAKSSAGIEKILKVVTDLVTTALLIPKLPTPTIGKNLMGFRP